MAYGESTFTYNPGLSRNLSMKVCKIFQSAGARVIWSTKISVKLGSLEKGKKVQQTRQLLGYEPTAFKLCVFIKKATLTRKSMSSIMTIPIQILQLHYIHFSFLLSLDRHKKIKKRPPGLVRLKRLNIFFQL